MESTLQMSKPAINQYPLTPLIEARWSPRAFADKAVETGKICSVLEAARWAHSSSNEQPWRFFVATPTVNPEALQKLQALLVPGNSWAKKAPVLMLSVAKLFFDYNGQPNRHAYHDVGLAVENMVLQALSMDLYVHQMGGFDFEKAVDTLGIPPGYEPVAMIAMGYLGSPDSLDEKLKAREIAPRSRNPLQDTAFSGHWGDTYPVCFT